MSRFCRKCGTSLNDNAMFCGNCGSKIEFSEFAHRHTVHNTDNSDYNSSKLHWILSFSGQILCVLLFFLPTIDLDALWMGKNMTIFKFVSNIGYSAIYIILLILYFVAAFIMILPVIKGNKLKSGKLIFMQIMSVLFFVTNVILYIIAYNGIKNYGFGVVNFSVNFWGWIYMFFSLIVIVDLMVFSLKLKKRKFR